ncbi:cobalamin (vitamin B12) biosynthesis CbiM protein [Ignisphaera aggregans DSM 17230]|uniref:Cobalamin (Vitamin B12) biosynthesis CbiM protein n=1 Tax=Ignisphaera aggregans (strain DSM 17230 / JCM 13409 / AQ1.S1) TaxID=583356 RepID=E0SQI2_IGNAA|nr:cobalamin (vitamin B12) biosynthesis CbiM protein [Ignisphaera aggregans DSM 17230]
MHIPDGFLDPYTAIVTYIVMIIFLVIAVLKTSKTLEIRGLSLAITLAAFIFVAQMIAWPIPGGTSLHMVGGALSAILLGPWMGFIVMFIVLLVQCLVFHDGGITALGANVLNMGIVATFTGYLIYKAIVYSMDRMGIGIGESRFLAGLLSGWISLGLAGTVCGIEIGISGEILNRLGYSLAISVPTMAIWHFILGIVEGFITGSIVSYIRSRNIIPIAAETR